MKPVFALIALAAASLLAGCTIFSYKQPLILAPVGPTPLPVAQESATGALVVYSAMNPFDEDISDPLDEYSKYSQYSDYEIWTPDGGRLLQKIDNHLIPFSDDDPTRVELKPGRYLVKAVSNRYGWVTVPVVIAAYQTTTVHLEGDDPKMDKTKSSPDKVYLPDGEVVGSRAPDQASQVSKP